MAAKAAKTGVMNQRQRLMGRKIYSMAHACAAGVKRRKAYEEERKWLAKSRRK